MQGRILLFNPAAERVLGYDASEVLGQPMIEELYPNGVARRIMALLRSKAHGGPGRLEQTRATICGKDGTEVPISMTGGMIYEYGAPRATFGIFTDLRERLEIENDLARTRLELMEREREAIAAQLAGAAAHELNQPLTSVMASVELLGRRLGDDERHSSMVRTIVAETERMARIVRKIGRITHYETTTYVGSTRIIDLDRSAEDSDSIELNGARVANRLSAETSEESPRASQPVVEEDAFRETAGENEDTDVGRPKDIVATLRATIAEEEAMATQSEVDDETTSPGTVSTPSESAWESPPTDEPGTPK
jgi:PAS domain S-box-containing protein